MRPLALVAALLLAGCVAPADTSDAPPPTPPGWSERILSWAEGHDHADPAQHEGLTTPNFAIVGYDPLLSPYHGGATPAGYLCGDAQATQDGRRLAVVESRSDIGFTIAEVTDPLAPRWLGEFIMRSTYVYDVAIVPDGKHVAIVTSQVQPGGLLPAAPALEWRSACASSPRVLALAPDPLPRPSSLILVSIEDPAEPVIVDQRPLAGLGHSVFSTILDGRTWVLASAVGTPGTDTFYFYEVASTPLGGRLNLLSTYVPPEERIGPDVGGHDDGVIAKHPITGATLAWLANRRDVMVLDLADPRAPREVGRWSDWTPAREGFSANLHSILPLDVAWGDKHYTIIGPEWTAKPRDHPTGIVWVLDTTDPANIVEVAAWTLPHDVEWSERLHFSNHYLGVWERTLFISMYHAGIWAIDLAPVGRSAFELLPSIGAFVPTRVSPKPPETPLRWAPTLEEALVLPGGDIVTFDSNSGLYVARFDATRPAPAPAPWPIERP